MQEMRSSDEMQVGEKISRLLDHKMRNLKYLDDPILHDPTVRLFKDIDRSIHALIDAEMGA